MSYRQRAYYYICKVLKDLRRKMHMRITILAFLLFQVQLSICNNYSTFNLLQQNVQSDENQKVISAKNEKSKLEERKKKEEADLRKLEFEQTRLNSDINKNKEHLKTLTNSKNKSAKEKTQQKIKEDQEKAGQLKLSINVSKTSIKKLETELEKQNKIITQVEKLEEAKKIKNRNKTLQKNKSK